MIGCPHAMFCLRSSIDYFVKHSSSVNLCSLDVAKAFDRVNHFCLLSKLMSKFVPVNIIMLLSEWFKSSTSIVCWHGVLSSPYCIYAGVRQGGVLSPFLFACYVDDIILNIINKGLGCHIGLQCMAILMYADDLVLISGSVSQLQIMINACTAELEKLDLTVNASKSVCVRIGKGYNCETCSIMSVNNGLLSWSDKLVYLGVTIVSGPTFSVDLKPMRAKFYRSFNDIYGKICKANACLILSLIKSFCVSIAMYCLEALHLNATALRGLDNLLFNALAKVFKTFDRNVLSQCLFYFSTFPLKMDYYSRRVNFLLKLKKKRIL